MAQGNTSKTDPVRLVLANLIAETDAPYTPDHILREFRATADKRRSDRELLMLLETISCRRPNHLEVLSQLTNILERKDPMYALLVFAERISEEPLKHLRNGNYSFSYEMPLPSSRSQSSQDSQSSSLRDEPQINRLRPHRKSKNSSLSTSTPLTSRKGDESPDLTLTSNVTGHQVNPTAVNMDPVLPSGDLSMIKKRVLNAVSSSILNSPSCLDTISIGSTTSSNRVNRSTSSSSIVSSNDIASDRINTALIPVDGDCIRNGDGSNFNSSPESVSEPSSSTNMGSVVKVASTRGYRTNMLWDYCKVDGHGVLVKQNVAALSVDSQQRVLLNELIYVLSGVRGTFIVPLPCDSVSMSLTKNVMPFSVNIQVDKSLREIVDQILPLAAYVMGIQKVMARIDDKGQVANALNSALQNLTTDYYILLSQVEMELVNNDLTVGKMLYYLQPTIWVMEEICRALTEVKLHKANGAAILSHLCNRIKRLGGDNTVQQLMIQLTKQAAEPYMRMLQLWIQKGVIEDSRDEFLVVDNEVIHRVDMPEHYSDDYWEKRYTMRKNTIPVFLDKYGEKILRTGKYLNVIRQCGKRVMPVQEMHLHFDPTSDQHEQVINDAYYFSARKLLDVLLTENDLMGHLQSVKRYLLLNQGDFVTQFMDACEDELTKNVDQVLPMTLENLLGLTLRLSCSRCDPYKDDLHCELLPYDLVTQMSKIMNQKEEYWRTNDRLDLSGLECFAFTYEVKWPVSLVLNHLTITKYQMLFRQLFFCKHVERQLCKIWKENSKAKKFSPQAAEQYRSAFTLRQRMMNAVQNLEYYMMIEIIEPNWHIFIEKMKKVENVDMVLKLHQDFLDLCLKNCMLTETSHVNRAIFKLCTICLKFCDFIQRSQRFFLDAELKSMVCDSSDENTDQSDTESDIPGHPQSETSLNDTDTFAERVKRFDLEFTGMLISFLKQINHMAKNNTADRFLNLVHRINFNGFYSEQMEKLCAVDAMG